MRAITIHDTRSGQLLPLQPRDPGHVSIYACGPTVYGRIHVGNARPFVVFSLFKRFLQHEGYEVTFVANVTDVNDKIYDAARAAGIPSEQLASEMTAHYVADTDALGLGRPDHEPLARETIAEIVALIALLIERGHAYAVEGDVYFDVRSYPAYGELSHRDVDQMDQGEGVSGASSEARPARLRAVEGLEGGRGHLLGRAVGPRPARLAHRVLGDGRDAARRRLRRPRRRLGPRLPASRERGRADRAAHGEPLARLWMHNGMVRLDGEKMAKSVGNIFLLHEALATHGRDALIAYFAGGHYRQPISYSGERLEEAARSVQRIRELGRRLDPRGADAAGAGAAARELLRRARRRLQHAESARRRVRLGARRQPAAGGGHGRRRGRPARAAAGAGARASARRRQRQRRPRRRGARAAGAPRGGARGARLRGPDALRDELAALGWTVRDGAAGPELIPRT